MNLDLYTFGKDFSHTEPVLAEIMGGKGANLLNMSLLGLPVPPGVTIPCQASIDYLNHSLSMTYLMQGVMQAVEMLESYFGYSPLLSVRSGARVSMPGMMDTILNVGLNDETVVEWAERIGDGPAWDSYRRLIQMFGEVVYDIDSKLFKQVEEMILSAEGVERPSQLNVEALQEFVKLNKRVLTLHGFEMPVSLKVQLSEAIMAVFKSWNSDRAKHYRKLNDIPEDWGTAVNVQSMVFGNMNEASCSGVAFTRNPETGEHLWYGEFLTNAQGEDVVSGSATPEPLDEMPEPWMYQLRQAGLILEQHFGDMQDIEFTVQDNEFFMLQTRSGKRSPKAAFRIAADLLKEGKVADADLPQLITTDHIQALSEAQIASGFSESEHGIGIAAGGSAFSGTIAFARQGMSLTSDNVLLAPFTEPEDFSEMTASGAILTSTGGKTSHAAVVARSMGKHCVVGLKDLKFSDDGKSVILNGVTAKAGDPITLCGSTGRVFMGIEVPLESIELTEDIKELLTKLQGTKVKDEVRVRDAKQAVGRRTIRINLTDFVSFAGFEDKPFVAAVSVSGVQKVILEPFKKAGLLEFLPDSNLTPSKVQKHAESLLSDLNVTFEQAAQ